LKGADMIKGLLDTKTTIPSASEISKNTQNAIKNFSLVPQDPSLPNNPIWAKMAKMWRITPEQAKRRRCGNCEYYENTPAMFEAMESIPLNKYDLYDGQAQRGYCHKLDFICHNSRVCSVWEEKEFILPPEPSDMENDNA
jgi:hypothetical protein